MFWLDPEFLKWGQKRLLQLCNCNEICNSFMINREENCCLDTDKYKIIVIFFPVERYRIHFSFRYWNSKYWYLLKLKMNTGVSSLPTTSLLDHLFLKWLYISRVMTFSVTCAFSIPSLGFCERAMNMLEWCKWYLLCMICFPSPILPGGGRCYISRDSLTKSKF